MIKSLTHIKHEEDIFQSLYLNIFKNLSNVKKLLRPLFSSLVKLCYDKSIKDNLDKNNHFGIRSKDV